MESFFSLLEKNVLDRWQWATRQELRSAIVTWIERTYHRRRMQASLGRLTPVEYETVMTTQAPRPRDQTCHPTLHQTLPWPPSPESEPTDIAALVAAGEEVFPPLTDDEVAGDTDA